jgi:serine phosphatase RsbU (regulator of sigma subunit)/ligand-binding sensor domain-containing protein
MKKLYHVLILLLIAAQGYSQESGRIFIRNFPPEEYKAATQNWNIMQDRRGIMYFSNIEGLLEYDGVSWKLTKLPGLHEILIGSNGQIYAALENDFGVLIRDDSGNLRYNSLKDKIPGGGGDISTVWQIHSQGDKIFFRTNTEIYILENNLVRVIKPETYFTVSISIGDTVYFRQQNKGLYFFRNDSLVLVDSCSLFATERISTAIPFGGNDILIVTRNKGIYIYSPAAKEKLHKPAKFKEVDRFLFENPGYYGIALPGSKFAIGTITGGIIIFDREGRIVKLINKDTGLLDNAVYGLFTDNSGLLWAALDNGISLIQYNFPFCFYNEQNGLNGNILSIYYYKNHLYAGTSQYLFVQNELGNFEMVQGTVGQNFDLKESRGTLLAAKNPGLISVKGNKAVLIPGTEDISFLVIPELTDDPDQLIAGSAEGLYLFKYFNSSWHLDKKIKGFDMPVYLAVKDKDGNIWASSLIDLYRLKISQDLDSITFYKQYKIVNRSSGITIYPSKLFSGEVIFGTDQGIYSYVQDKDVILPHPDFGMLKGSVSPIIQINNNDIWFEEVTENRVYEKGILRLRNGKYEPYKRPFYKFSDMGCADICVAPDSTIFIGTFSGLLRYDPNVRQTYDRHFNTLIRKVNSGDSVLYGGDSPDDEGFQNIAGPDVSFPDNNMVFHFAATSYEDSEKNLYSYQLSGQDTAWSDWGRDTKKEYTNLREGNYKFEVKSVNQYQETGSTATYSFRILPPWYRTWWAFAIYGIMSVFFIWLIVKLNIRRLEKQKDQLEKTVTERTAQLKSTLDVVNFQKLEIETAHGQIKDSINYAKYIQTAILPNKELLDMYLKDYFVVFSPKDIVSGDFYWATFIEDLTIIAAVDCTGHGVPGAFMSMLGAALLNEIINKEYITHPGVILRRLRKEIIRSLHQRGETGELKDGMDISLCTIDFANLKLQYAGANNPLYIIRKKDGKKIDAGSHLESEDNILYEIKADRMPISIHASMKEFTTHEIEIDSGDMLYLFSDGYADQFGGPDGKKLHYRAFRKILLDNACKSAEDQKLNLERSFSEWKGDHNQIDDVMIVGIRV